MHRVSEHSATFPPLWVRLIQSTPFHPVLRRRQISSEVKCCAVNGCVKLTRVPVTSSLPWAWLVLRWVNTTCCWHVKEGVTQKINAIFAAVGGLVHVFNIPLSYTNICSTKSTETNTTKFSVGATMFLLKYYNLTHFNITLSSVCRLFKRIFPLSFPHQNTISIFLPPIRTTCPAHLLILELTTQINNQKYQSWSP